jgi:queuine/archaeosine tRNA-ribosyltransferase
MTTNYLPVSTLGDDAWNESMHWLKPAKFFYYPKLLATPFVTGWKKKRANFETEENKKDLKIVADSGGYQISTQDAKVNALDVLEWQQGIADIGFTLDYPVHGYQSNVKNYKEYTKEYFDKCMKASNDAAWSMLETNEENKYRYPGAEKKMEVWGVLHGRNITELREWYEHLTKEHTFPGYSIPITDTAKTNKGFGLLGWFDQLPIAHEIDAPIHWLGRSEALIVVVVAKLSQVTGHNYTYDTSSSIAGPRWGGYFDPYYHNMISLSMHEERRAKLSGLPCDCPVCKEHTVEEMANSNHAMLLHNVYCRIKWNDYVNALVSDDDLFKITVNRLLDSNRSRAKQKNQIWDAIDQLIFSKAKKSGDLNEFW